MDSTPSLSSVQPLPAQPNTASPDSPRVGAGVTLFVADIPIETGEIDFRAIFSECDGFMSARLRKDRNDNTVGFVEFVDHESAAVARDRLSGHKFFCHTDDGITIHFAHGNTRFKHSREESGSKPSYSGSQPHYQQQSNESQGNHSPSRKGYSGYRNDGYGIRAPDVNRVGVQSGLPLMPALSVPQMLPPAGLTLHGPDMSGNMFYSTVAPYPSFSSSTYPQPQPLPLPVDAASTLYVEGLPLDATEREVAHIFRQVPGYISLRIMPKESKQHPVSRTFNLCFVEFDNKFQATVALHHLQGYKIDKNDTKGLTISYAKTARKERRGPPSLQSLNGLGLTLDKA